MAQQFNATLRRLAVLVVLVLGSSVFLLRQSSDLRYSLSVPDYIAKEPQSQQTASQANNVTEPNNLSSKQEASHVPSTQQSDAQYAPKVSSNYSLKPIAYIFPQYYVFKDNNEIHGANFTEWVNVEKVTENGYGLGTIRPHKSIGGYYDGLEYATRKRQGDFLRDHGFYGGVFHHYWFAGRPVMDHVIQAMLNDGEPNIPFMLSWANEPWSARWDGGNSGKVLIAQEYGLQQAWRKHFDWLFPFFKHPLYIRSEGKVQFAVYNPMHMGHLAPQMFAAWRQWAVEEGLGGMDIIETRWNEGSSTWDDHPPDAINEFQPHAGGRDWAKFSSTKRLSSVYHRGTLVCWDTTPRHPTDGRAVSLPACHPKTWKHHLVEMFRKIKSDPNPIGAENFFFVNALNEWGEGNSIEPSVQFGDGYGLAMKEAMEITEKQHVWPDISTKIGMSRDRRISTVINMTADVCVLVRASSKNAEDQVFTLPAMLQSLQAQNNIKWRAVVYQGDRIAFESLDRLILQALDARISRIEVPEDFTAPEDQNWDFLATDWVIQNLRTYFPACATAKNLLVTDASNTYEETAFDTVAKKNYDLLGLNVESRKTIWHHPRLRKKPWKERCARLEDPSLNLCFPTKPTNEAFELSATFFDLQRFLEERHLFSAFTEKYPGLEAFKSVESLIKRGWNFNSSSSAACQLKHNPSYSSCLKTGNFWFDSPIFEEMGCYTQTEFESIEGKTSPGLRHIDLQHFREHGTCMRYKEEVHWSLTHPGETLAADEASEVHSIYLNGTATSLGYISSTATTVISAASHSVSLPLSSLESAVLVTSSLTSSSPGTTQQSKKDKFNAELKQVVHR